MHPIGEAARRSGVKIETIRWYEREGVVPPAERSAAGRRRYDDAAVARLGFVRRCRDLGFPLAEIRTLLALPAADAPCDAVRALGERRLAGIRTRLEELRALESALSGLLADCAAGREDCPALDRLFEPAATPGPQRAR